MTNEEKAKAYDEALALAKRLISNNCTEVEKLCLKCVFPELKESEDEKIRKHLIEIVETYWGTTNDPGKAADLAYLEKQKEQKHPNGCFTCDEYKKGYEEGRRNGFTVGYNKAMKEVEQKEQKPAEWSEEDEKWINYFYSLLGLACEKDIHGLGQKAIDAKMWLKSLRPQPKQERRNNMKAPDEIYIQPNAHDGWFEGNKPNDNFVEYIRKDIVDETIKTAEDHAYFAGQEKLRERLLEWAKQCFRLQDSGSWYSKGAADAFSKLIDKLNEM